MPIISQRLKALFRKNPDLNLAFHNKLIKDAIARTKQINKELSNPNPDFPKTQRALLFFESRPLMKYMPPRMRLVKFLQELGVEISSEDELGTGEDNIVKWMGKAEKALTPEKAAGFEKLERLIRP